MPRRVMRLDQAEEAHKVGAKAYNLHWLQKHNAKVPLTFVLPFAVHCSFMEQGTAMLEELRHELAAALDPQCAYAVRSSANLEDAGQHSYAGQFKTVLNVRGIEAILQAIKDVFEAGHSPAAQTYASKMNQSIEQLALAVIIQEMVTPVVSGVSFSRNPLTGLNEVIVEAVRGSGEALVQGGQTPARWIYKWGSWLTQPSDSPLALNVVQQIVDETMRIEEQYGVPIDLEWVYDGSDVYLVQLRPITQLDDINIYSNRIAREVFPGLIKPLVWSVNVPLVNSAWIRLFTELIGPNTLKPEELAKAFAYRAYFNMGVIGRIFTMLGFPRESLELLMGLEGGNRRPRFRPTARTLRHVPRMLAFAVRASRFHRRVLPQLTDIQDQQASLLAKKPETLEDAELLAQISHLYQTNQETAYLNIVVPLLMNLYNALLRRQLSGLGVDPAMFDLTHGMADLAEHNPAFHLQRLAQHYNQLDQAARAALLDGDPAEHGEKQETAEFRAYLDDFLRRFGHLSDSGNDFSAVPWRENPALVMQMIRAEAQRQTENPAQDIPETHNKLTWQELPLSTFQRLYLGLAYRRAREYRLYREMVSSTYTYGYGQFRTYFLELGRRLVARGELEEPGDIFYLSWEEITAHVREHTPLAAEENPLREIVARRKAEMMASKDLTLPDIIYGDHAPPLQDRDRPGNILKGIPAARGYYQGPARVITRVTDFDRLRVGDVLVIPYSDVSWTPLFTRAGAVVAESGGLLSHSAIVAREFNLPCVVSVPNACQIPDGTPVTVDGFTGNVTLLATS